MKKLLTVLLAAVLSLGIFAACGEKTKDETAPEISGVKATVAIESGQDFDALAGVTAQDDVDGDITDKITVSSIPELTFTDGKATVTEQGDYEIIYSVKDKAGNEGNAYTTLTVTRSIASETTFHKYTFGDSDTSSVDKFGFELTTGENAGEATFGIEEGVLRVDVTHSGNAMSDVHLERKDFVPVPSGETLVEYDVVYTMRSSANALFSMAVNNGTEGTWNPLASQYNVQLTPEWKDYTLTFKSPEAAEQKLQFILELGQHDFGTAEAPNKQNPEAYTVDILYIKLIERTGEEKLTSAWKADYSAATTGLAMTNANFGSVSFADGKATANVTGYGAASWENKLEQDTTITVDPEKKYRLSVTMTAASAQAGEICVEDKTLEWQNRALYTAFALEAGKETTITCDFNQVAPTWASPIENVCVKIYIGAASAGVTANTITISNIEIFEVTGDFAADTSLYRFTEYSKESEWNYFNGREETLDSGMGAMWEADGKLFYRIDEISTADYGNKLFINKIQLEKNALYKVKFTIKANKPGTVWFILNPYGEYDPRISQTFNFTTEEQTFECSTTGEFVLDMDFELVWSFGQGYNTEGDYLIEISQVEIIKMT